MQCKLDGEKKHPCMKKSIEPESPELISALAAGMNAQLIVEVSSAPSTTTIALAAAARQTCGRLVCIFPAKPDTLQADSSMQEFGLEDTTEFVIGEANELLPSYKNVEFCLIDCKLTQDCSASLFQLLNINPSLAVVVANNLLDRTTTGAYDRTFKKIPGAKSITLPIGKGIEVTRIGTYNSSSSQTQNKGIITDSRCTSHAFRGNNKKSKWIVHIDERTGEEHVFRVVKHRAQLNSL